MTPVAVSQLVHTGNDFKTPTLPSDMDLAGPSTNTSAVLHGARDLRIEERPYIAPSGDQVQIRVRCTGLCGSDLHYYLHGRNGAFALQQPMCLGHESAGEIVAIGPNVPQGTFKMGDRVAIEAGQMCGSCLRCKEGRYNLCKKMRFASSAKTFPHLDGTLQKYMNWPYWLVHKLPDSVSLTSAALCEPLCVVLQGVKRANLQAGQSVLIFGAGAVGLLACAVAKASGASFVAAVDIDESKLQFARDNGWADATYLLPHSNSSSTSNDNNDSTKQPDNRSQRAAEDQSIIEKASTSASQLLETLGSSSDNPIQQPPHDLSTQGFDMVFECTGVPFCVQQSIFSTRAGGKVVLIGMGHPIQTLPIGAAALAEIDIMGVFRYANMYPVAIDLLASGTLRSVGNRLDVTQQQNINQTCSLLKNHMGGIENLISHKYSLTDAVKAFETLANGRDLTNQSNTAVVKVLIVDEQES